MRDMVQIPREALENIQWVWGVKTLRKFCPICKANSQDGHTEDCPIGIALKPKEVVEEKVIPQHEMMVDDQKYITKLGIARSECGGCVFFKKLRCEFPFDCIGAANSDGLNRIWVKAE